MAQHYKIGVVLVGAGSSSRMGADKMAIRLLHKPVLAWSVEAFEKHNMVNQISIVLSKNNMALGHELRKAQKWKKVFHICEGGERRQDSVRKGLQCIEDCDIVMIHDAARPFVTSKIIEQGIVAVKATGAAIAAVKVSDTIKTSNELLEVVETSPRTNQYIIQTPQVFDYELIMKAHKTVTANVTDDATMVEMIGGKVMMFESSKWNIKITTPDDILLGEQILKLGLNSAKSELRI